jgi:hypothetical protein
MYIKFHFLKCLPLEFTYEKYWQAYGIDQLVLPTRDYCFAPSLNDISQAVSFIHGEI